jgi:hypothetical protein
MVKLSLRENAGFVPPSCKMIQSGSVCTNLQSATSEKMSDCLLCRAIQCSNITILTSENLKIDLLDENRSWVVVKILPWWAIGDSSRTFV